MLSKAIGRYSRIERFFINIIITELPAEEAPKGRLINLDLVKELDSIPSRARYRTSTM
jgi:hypothetical protein